MSYRCLWTEDFLQPDTLSKQFTTLPPDPSVSEVIVEDITLTEGTVLVTIANPGTSSKTVYVRYRTGDTRPWSDPPITTTTVTGTAMKTLSWPDLPVPDTKWKSPLGVGFLPAETESTTFTTLLPRVSSVSLENVTTSEATVKVTIAEPGPGVNIGSTCVTASCLQHKASWATPSPKVGGRRYRTTFALTGLSPAIRDTKCKRRWMAEFMPRKSSPPPSRRQLPRASDR